MSERRGRCRPGGRPPRLAGGWLGESMDQALRRSSVVAQVPPPGGDRLAPPLGGRRSNLGALPPGGGSPYGPAMVMNSSMTAPSRVRTVNTPSAAPAPDAFDSRCRGHPGQSRLGLARPCGAKAGDARLVHHSPPPAGGPERLTPWWRAGGTALFAEPAPGGDAGSESEVRPPATPVERTQPVDFPNPFLEQGTAIRAAPTLRPAVRDFRGRRLGETGGALTAGWSDATPGTLA